MGRQRDAVLIICSLRCTGYAVLATLYWLRRTGYAILTALCMPRLHEETPRSCECTEKTYLTRARGARVRVRVRVRRG